jgi:hypothetical protein
MIGYLMLNKEVILFDFISEEWIINVNVLTPVFRRIFVV